MRRFGLLLIITLLAAGCGKKGALVYPDMLVSAPPASFAAQQTGQVMKLSFVLPKKDRAGRTLNGLAGIRIFKKTALAGQEPGCSACTADFTLLRTLYLDVLQDAQQYGSLVLLLDGDVKEGREYSYRATPFTKDGVDGESTPQIKVSMTTPPLPPVLKVLSAPTEIRLEFAAETAPWGVLSGYNLYRSAKGDATPYLPLNSAPVAGNSYVDSGLDRGAIYLYTVRSLVRMPSGQLVESGPSNQMEGRLQDDE